MYRTSHGWAPEGPNLRTTRGFAVRRVIPDFSRDGLQMFFRPTDFVVDTFHSGSESGKGIAALSLDDLYAGPSLPLRAKCEALPSLSFSSASTVGMPVLTIDPYNNAVALKKFEPFLRSGYWRRISLQISKCS